MNFRRIAPAVCTLAACFSGIVARADEGELRHCPLTVKGAKATLRNVDKGIEVVVTGATAEAASEIRRRAKNVAAMTSGDDKNQGEHGRGAGGGGMKNCPIVAKDTFVREEDVEAGSKITMMPKGELTIDALRQDEWVVREIIENAGEAFIIEARFVHGLSDSEVEAMFNEARNADYLGVRKELQQTIVRLSKGRKPNEATQRALKIELARIKRRLGDVASIDFFIASGSQTVSALVSELEARREQSRPKPRETKRAALSNL